MLVKYFSAILVLVAVGLLPAPAHAEGVVSVCDEAHLLAALAGGGTVTFACSGVITLANTITIAANTTIDGSGQEVTISGNDTVRVFYVNEWTSFNLNEITIANGYFGAPGGAGVYNRGTLTVSTTVFCGNSVQGRNRGGGIYNRGTASVSNSIFLDNDADDLDGGGVGGAIHNDIGTLTVTGSSFSENRASDIGGGISNAYGATLAIHRSIFLSNRATHEGGAIRNSGTLIVSDSTLTNNSAASSYDSYGGGIYNYGSGAMGSVSNSIFSGNSARYGSSISNENGSEMTVANSTFSGNNAAYGGGISNSTSSATTVVNSTFSGNNATYGGGIWNDYHGALTVVNSTLSGNTATVGGGISNNYRGALTVVNSTISGNNAAAGGGISNHVYGSVVLENTIVANNQGRDCYGAVTDGGGNLSFPDATCPGINADPVLGPLQDNGGPTWTTALSPGSAAIDAGSDAICAADPVDNRDQRGVMRPQGVHCDTGAFERPIKWLPIMLVE